MTPNPKDFNDSFDSLIYINAQEILDDIKNPKSRWKFKKWLDYNPALVKHLTPKQNSMQYFHKDLIRYWKILPILK